MSSDIAVRAVHVLLRAVLYIQVYILPLITAARATATCGIYGSSPPTAIIGEKLTLICALRQVCLSGEYEWYHITDTNNIPLSETSNELLVSDNVTSAAEVGGKLYECHCSGDLSNTNCRRFEIAGIWLFSSLYIPEQYLKWL